MNNKNLLVKWILCEGMKSNSEVVLALFMGTHKTILDKSSTTKQTEVKHKLRSIGIKKVNGDDSELKSII